MALVGRSDVIREPWFESGHTRAQHADELDAAVAAWIGERSTRVVIDEFERAQAAIAQVYDVRGILADPQYRAIGTVTTVDDEQLGPVKMQNVLFRLSETPGAIRWAGRAHGHDTDDVLAEIGVTREQVEALRERGVV
jgi:crotonobetainyl-CoA:carnitine CoA-transferase CaiB-like acyl-CoA transferase